MKKMLSIFVLIAGICLAVIWHTNAAYQGADVLGQLTSSDLPDFDKALSNNAQGDRILTPNLGTAIDTVHHRLFATDAGGGRSKVLVFNLDSSNNLVDHVADYVLGKPNFSTNAGSASQSTLTSAAKPAYDSVSNRLFVCDANRVLVYDVSTISNGMNASYVLGAPDFTTNAAATTQSRMSNPRGCIYDETTNRLFVADTGNHRVLVFDTATSTIANGMNASYVLGQADFTSGSATTTQSGMNDPRGITYDPESNRLFVSTNGDERILVFDVTTSAIANGMNASYVLGQADFTSGTASTSQSRMSIAFGGGVGYDATNRRLFLSDRNNSRVMIWNVATSTIANGMNAINVLGQTSFTSSTGATTQSGLLLPNGDATYDPTTNYLYVGDANNQRIMIFDVNPATITNGMNAIDLLGQLDTNDQPVFTTNFSGTILPNSRGFNTPRGIALDTTAHRLFVADGTNNRIEVFNLDSSNNLLDKVADNVLGQSVFTTSTGATTQSGMSGSFGLAYDVSSSRLFAADSSNNRVLVFDVATITNGMNATNVLGQFSFTVGTAGTSVSSSSNPQGLAYDSQNQRLFLADRQNNRVLVYDVSSTSNGMSASYVLGQTSFGSSTASTSQSGMSAPVGLVYDASSSRLFVGELSNNRVTVFDVATSTIANGMNASFVLGQSSFTASSSQNTQAGLSQPTGLEYDPVYKRLFVVGFANHRITVFDVATSTIANGANAVAVLGQHNFTDSGASTTLERLSSPLFTAFDQENNRLYVSDTGSHRVLIYNTLRLPNSALSVGSKGSGDYQGRIEPGYAQGVTTCALVNGSLPTGLTLTTSTCTVTGTPTIVGSTSFSIRATDEVSGIGNFIDDHDYSITIQPPGGGGGTITQYLPPPTRVPPFNVSLVINGGATSTVSRNVSISANATFSPPSPGAQPSMTPTVVLSNSDIISSVFIPPQLHTSTIRWDLCGTYGGYGPPENPCREGFHTVYARVYSPWNVASDVVTSSIVYAPPGAAPVSAYTSPLTRTVSGTYEVAPSSQYPSYPSTAPTQGETPGLVRGKDFVGITRWLLEGIQGDDVLLLQRFLNQKGYLIGEQAGFFGPITRTAVIQFQEAYFNEILAPKGFRRGTGIFATSTRGFVIKNY